MQNSSVKKKKFENVKYSKNCISRKQSLYMIFSDESTYFREKEKKKDVIESPFIGLRSTSYHPMNTIHGDGPRGRRGYTIRPMLIYSL